MSGQPSTPSTSKASSGLGKIFNKLRTPSGANNGSPSGGGAGGAAGDSTPRSASPFGSILGRRSSSKTSLRAYGNNVPLPPSLNGSSTSLAGLDWEDEPAFPTFDSDALPPLFQSTSASSSTAPKTGPYGAHYPSTSTLGSSLSLASSAADDQTGTGAPFNDLTAQPPPRPGTSMSTRSRAGSIADGEGAGWKSSLLGRNGGKEGASGSFGRALGRSLGLKGKETSSSALSSQSSATYGAEAEGDEDEATHKVPAVKSQDFAAPPARAPLTRQLSQEPPPASSSTHLATTTPGLPRSGLSKSTTATSTAGPSAGTRRLFRTTTGGGERIVGRARRVVQPAATSTPESQPSFSESDMSSTKEPSPEPLSSAQTSPASSSIRSRPPISPNTHGRSRSELPPASPKMTQAERAPATVTIGPSHLNQSATRPSSSLSHYAGSDADVSPPDVGSQLSGSRLRPLHSSQQPLGSTAFRNRFLNSSSMNSLSSSSNQSPDLPSTLSASSGATPSPPMSHSQPALSSSAAAAAQQQQPKIRLGPMAGGLSRKNSISMLAAVAEKADSPPTGTRAASLDIRRENVAARVAGQLAESRSSLDETRRSPPRDQQQQNRNDRDMMMPYLSRRTSVSRTASAADVSLDQSIASSATLIGSSGSSLKRSNSETITNGSLMTRPGSSTAMYRDDSQQQSKPSNVVRLAPIQQHEMAPPAVVEVLHDPHPQQHYQPQQPYQQQQQQHEEYPARPPSAQAIHPYQDENAYSAAPSYRHAPPPPSSVPPPQQPLPPHPASVGQPGRPVLAEVNRYAPIPPSTQPRAGQPLYQKQGGAAAAGHEYHVPLRDRSPGMAEATPSVTVQQAHYQSQPVFSQQQQQQMMMQQQQMMQMGYTPGAEQHPEKKVAKAFTVNGKSYFRAGLLGKGGSSRVYRVMTERNELYALKKVDTRNDAESRASFINEITLLRKLAGKPEIIQLLDSEVQGKYVIMVMEAGETDLAGLLAGYSGKPISLNFIRYVWEQMLSAVQVIHDEAVVHTDLKPANFVLVKGRLKLIDFGISKAIAGDTTNIGRDQQIGTANYMPPEALNDTGLGQGGKRLMKLGRAADVWSLGCILYQMVYGQAPFAHIRDIGLKIQTIMSERHRINYSDTAAPLDKNAHQIEEHRFKVGPDLISTLRSCLLYDSKKRATIPQLLQQPFLRRSGDEAVPSPQPASQYPQISDKMMEGVVKIVADQLVRGKLAQEDVAAMASNLMKQIHGLQDSLRG